MTKVHEAIIHSFFPIQNSLKLYYTLVRNLTFKSSNEFFMKNSTIAKYIAQQQESQDIDSRFTHFQKLQISLVILFMIKWMLYQVVLPSLPKIMLDFWLGPVQVNRRCFHGFTARNGHLLMGFSHFMRLRFQGSGHLNLNLHFIGGARTVHLSHLK